MEEIKSIEPKSPKTSLKDKIKNFDYKDFIRNHIYEIAAYLGFILTVIIFTIVVPISSNGRTSIWSSRVMSTYIEQLTVYMILAIGASFVYMMGCMDISVGYQVGVFGTIFIMISNASGSIFVGLLVIIALGIICAIFNAIVGAYVKLPMVMSSVILMQLFRGLMTMMYSDSGLASRTIDINLQGVVDTTAFRIVSLVLLAIIGAFLIGYTKIGKRAKAIGANKVAASQAGADLLKTRIICYGIFGLFLCASAVFLIARKNGIGESDSASYQMDIMIMLLMGGMPLSGGMKSKLGNAIVGTLTYTLLSIGLGLCRVPAEYIFLVKSVIFVIIVGLTCRKPGDVLPR
jgi:ribose transport system permease protein